MSLIRALFVALAMLISSAPLARAQEPSPQQYQALMRWASDSQNILQGALAPFQNMPPPFYGDSVAERTAWATLARNWVSTSLAAVQTARRQSAQLGPVPEAGPTSALYRQQGEALLSLFTTIESFLVEYTASILAVERNDDNALQLAAVAAVDAQILLQAQFRNINAIQAESVGDGPQRHLLRSFASSYDGLMMVLQARRSAYLGEDTNMERAPLVRAAADAMRLHLRTGRAAAQQVEASLPAQVSPEESELLRRAHLVYRSFGGSFDREAQIAATFDSIAALLGSGRGYAAIEEEVNDLIRRLAELDTDRVRDIQYRLSLFQNIQAPPT